MIKLLKTLLLMIVISIFCFSDNSTISNARKFIYCKSKMLYHMGTNALIKTNVSFFVDLGKLIK
jgi:hypothetical protein